MTNAHIETTAASGAKGRLLARLARRGVAVCLLACVGIGAAQAQYHGRRDDAQLQPPPAARGERLALPPQLEQQRERMFDQQRDQQREQQQREERRQAVQEMQHEGARDGGRRGGRLTPDERRELRRQVNEAQMDIYPGRGRR